MLPLVFDKRFFLLLSVGFVFAVVIGTLLHESGHWIVGRCLGFAGQHVGYNYTSSGTPDNPINDTIRNRVLIIAGGPLQTILTGTFGLVLLIFLRKIHGSTDCLSFSSWVAVFLSLFWLRELFNLAVASVQLALGSFRMRGDEFSIARYFQWHPWSISIAAGIVGLVVLWFVVFTFIPAKQRLTFILSGIVGCFCGYCLWLVLLGPILMP